MLSWFRRQGPAAVFGHFCALLIGIALTWTCAIYGLLIVTQSTTCGGGKSRQTRLRVRSVAQAAIEYAIDNKRCPATIDVLADEKYLPKVGLADSWGTRIAFRCSGDHMEDPIVSSAGPDRTFGTPDDVTNE
jgi:hypothetical protein